MLAVWLCVWAAALVYAQAEIEVFKKVGGEVVLKVGTSPQPITSIIWKQDGNLAIEWEKNEMDKYRQFKERGHLNVANAEMTITGLTLQDSGTYTPEINNIQGDATHLRVITAVPIPVVTKSCDEMRWCMLTCEGDTTEAGPLNYTWWSDDRTMTNGSQKSYRIHKELSKEVKEFSCQLENPVSRERSETIANPLLSAEGVKVGTGVIVFLSLLVAVGLLVAIHRLKTGMWFFQKGSMPWELDFWRKGEAGHAVESNGPSTAQPLTHTEAEETHAV